MKQKMSIILTLCFFGALILGAYIFLGNKYIKRHTEWAKGKITVEEGKYDVIVVGSDPEGIAAALGAARSGGKVLLLGKEEGPGGLFTYGMLNTLDMNRNSQDILLNKGVFAEFYNSIGNTESFDVEKAKKVFLGLIEDEKNLEYKPSYKFGKAILEGNTIIGVKMINSQGEEESFYGKRVIDATQDGDVSVSAGAPYTIGMEDINLSQKMAATLVFKVGGVKWKDIRKDINKYKEQTRDEDCGINRSTAWGFGKWCYDEYKPLHKNMQLRGPNFGLQEDGSILVNALQIFDVDGLNDESKALAMEQGKKEAENVLKYLKSKLGSFKNAYIDGFADELYIRETRHIKGEYLLKATDVLGNVDFWDKIALASYPIDIQATSKSNTGYVIGTPEQYSIPYRCTVPLNVENLFIVGKAASYSSIAAGSARVVPTGMAVGEAIGIASIYTIYKDVTPRDLTLEAGRGKLVQLQGILQDQGMYLKDFDVEDPNINVKEYEKIKKIINLGLVSGGYDNNFGFENNARQDSLCYLLMNLLQRGAEEKYTYSIGQKLIQLAEEKENLTGAGAARACSILMESYVEPAESDVEKDFIAVRKTYNTKKNEYDRIKDKYDETKASHKKIKKAYEDVKEKYNNLKPEYEKARDARIERIKEETWEIAKKNNYFSEEFGKDEVLNKRQMYVLAVDIVEKLLGREI